MSAMRRQESYRAEGVTFHRLVGAIMLNRTRLLLAVLLAIVAACGGGGPSGPPPSSPDCAPGDDPKIDLHPHLDCVSVDGLGRGFLIWGYRNDAKSVVSAPLGPANEFAPSPPTRGQPTTFDPGTHRGVFSTPAEGVVGWVLGSEIAYAMTLGADVCPINPAVPGVDLTTNVDGHSVILRRDPSAVVDAAIVDTVPLHPGDLNRGILPTATGYTPGEFAVSSDGAATYSIALDVPPGRMGVAPQVGLSYNSRKGNGPLGVGWSLSGLSAISRCGMRHSSPNGPANAPDGHAEGVTFTSTDHYCLDGDYLVEQSAAPGSNTREFRPEHDPFTRVLATGDVGGALGPSAFVVYAAGGAIRTYGPDPGSRLEGFRTVVTANQTTFDAPVEDLYKEPARLLWGLAETADRSGNKMFVEYDARSRCDDDACERRHTLELRPKAIRYTFGPEDPTTRRSVVFNYSASRRDPQSAFVAGYETSVQGLLVSVEISGPNPVEEQILRRYLLTYNFDLVDLPRGGPVAAVITVTGRSLLQRIQECDSHSVCKGPTDLNYDPGLLDYDDINTGIGRNGPDDLGWGDGVGDRQAGAMHWALLIADIDGDGRDDILYRKRTSSGECLPDADAPCTEEVAWFFRRSVLDPSSGKASFEGSEHDTGLPRQTEFRDKLIPMPRPVDIDGDGKPELMFPIAGTRQVSPPSLLTKPEWQTWTFDVTANQYVAPASDDAAESGESAIPEACTPLPGVPGGVCLVWPSAMYVQDLDGDGMPDLARVRKDYSPDYYTSTESEWAYRRNVAGVLAASYKTFSKPLEFVLGTPTPITTDFEILTNQFMNSYGASIDGSGRSSLLIRLLSKSLGGSLDGSRYGAVALGPTGLEARQTTLPLLQKSFSDPEAFHYIFVDMNGDGLDEAVAVRDEADGKVVDSRGVWPRLAVNTGNGHRPFVDNAFSGLGLQSRAFNTASDPTIDRGVRVLDANEDGLPDLVLFGNTGYDSATVTEELPRDTVIIYQSTGDGFAWSAGPVVRAPGSPTTKAIPTGGAELPFVRGRGYPLSQTLDVNGDGLGDMVHWDSSTGSLHLYRRAGDKADQLVTIRNGIGHDIAIDYAPTVSGTSPGDGRCRYPLSCVVRGMWGVSTYFFGIDSGLSRTKKFLYEGPVVDRLGRGWLGFTRRVESDDFTHATTTTKFDLLTVRVGASYPYARSITDLTTELDASPGVHRRRSRAVNCLGVCITALQIIGDPARSQAFTVVETSVVETDEENGVLLRQTQVSSTYGDPFGNLTAQDLYVPGLALHQSVTLEYDNDEKNWLLGLLTRREETSTAPSGVVTRVDTFEIDSKTGLTMRHTVEPTGDADSYLDTLFTRNASGQVVGITEKDRAGSNREVWRTYNRPEGITPATVVDALGQTSVYDFHPGLGLLVRSIAPNGSSTHYQYDRLGHLVFLQSEEGDTLTVSFQDIGALGYAVKEVSGSGHAVLTKFDNLDRVSERTTRAFDGQDIVESVKYDRVFPWQVAVKSAPHFRSAPPASTLFAYDNLGRLRFEQMPDGATTEHQYDKHLTTTIDPRGRRMVVDSDERGRIVRTIQQGIASFDDASPHEVATAYSYGPFDQLEVITDAKKHETRFGYDVLGRRILLQDPDTGANRTAYNAFGDVRTETDGRGILTQFWRDQGGRVTAVTNPQDGATCLVWDTAPGGIAQLATAASPDGVIDSYLYNGTGQLVQHRAQIGFEDLGAIDYGYDAFGRIDTITYPELTHTITGEKRRLTVRNDYSLRDGGLQSVSVGSEKLWSLTAVDARGQIAGQLFGNGAVATNTFEPQRGFLVGSRLRVGSTAVADMTFGYYSDGDLQSVSDSVTTNGETYDYDDADRLKTWQILSPLTSKTQEYAYDDLNSLRSVNESQIRRGKTSSAVTTLYDIDGTYGPHAVTTIHAGSAPPQSYTYDEAGRQTSAPDRLEVRYRTYGLATSITTRSATRRFSYDAFHRRVLKNNDTTGESTKYLDGLYEHREAPGMRLHVMYVQGRDGVVAQINVAEKAARFDTVRRFLHRDAVGSSVIVSKDDKSVERQRFEPFGKRLEPLSGAPDGAPLADVTDGFGGHEEDEDIGLVDMGGRHYDPQLRRFLTPDPLSHGFSSNISGALNRFAYALNNPLRFSDPSGLTDEWIVQPVYVEGDAPDPLTASTHDPDQRVDIAPHPESPSGNWAAGGTHLSEQAVNEGAAQASIQGTDDNGNTNAQNEYYGPHPAVTQVVREYDAIHASASSYASGNVKAFCSFCTSDPLDLLRGPNSFSAFRAFEDDYREKVDDFMGDVDDHLAIAGAGLEAGAVASFRAVARETTSSNARKLARALEKAGELKPLGPVSSAAHHIVASGAKLAQPARDILAHVGIGINDAKNGAWLFTRFHEAIHAVSPVYYRAVNELLTQAQGGGKQAVIETLEFIAEELKSGRIPK